MMNNNFDQKNQKGHKMGGTDYGLSHSAMAAAQQLQMLQHQNLLGLGGINYLSQVQQLQQLQGLGLGNGQSLQDLLKQQ